eukprot:6183723-Pleurochrysis_carterae.AAC.1
MAASCSRRSNAQSESQTRRARRHPSRAALTVRTTSVILRHPGHIHVQSSQERSSGRDSRLSGHLGRHKYIWYFDYTWAPTYQKNYRSLCSATYANLHQNSELLQPKPAAKLQTCQTINAWKASAPA